MIEPKTKTEDKSLLERERAINKQWLAFSKTEAWNDFQEYAHSTSDMLVSYAKERVMPSPIKGSEMITIDSETASSLLQNARGCDIVITYAEERILSAQDK